MTFLRTGAEIIKRETPLGLYKGLGAVVTGIVPKMAIRFTSFEWYKGLAAHQQTGVVSGRGTFFGGFTHLSFCLCERKGRFPLSEREREIFSSPGERGGEMLT